MFFACFSPRRESEGQIGRLSHIAALLVKIGWIGCAIYQEIPKRLPGFFSLFYTTILNYFLKYETTDTYALVLLCPRVFVTYYSSCRYDIYVDSSDHLFTMTTVLYVSYRYVFNETCRFTRVCFLKYRPEIFASFPWGAFNNYVDQILTNFDHLPPSSEQV